MDLTKGVAFNEPPAPLLDAIRRHALATASDIAPDADNALVLVPTTAGINGAIVSRFGEHWRIAGFVGKTWGEPLVGGGAVQFKW